jgi:DNA-binding protein H-NS
MDYWTVKVQDSDLAANYEDAIAELYKQAAHIFVISQRMKLRIESRYQLNPSLVSVAHNYVPATLPSIFLDKESSNPDELTVFYSGNLDPDQSIDPLLDICKAIEILNAKSLKKYVFIVRTSSYHIKNSGHVFADIPFVKLEEQSGDFNAYLADSASADLCLLCYGFGADSRRYLMDSMANKLPDLLTAKAKFLGYGDPEIGTLAYLSSCRYPFLDFTRDINVLAGKIEELASMTREDYIEACGESIGTMSNEFSEMAQCHVFQRQLASAADTDVEPSTKLVEKFTQILKLSQQKISDATQRELNLMAALVGHRELINNVYTLVREHGIDWSVNSSRAELEKNIKTIPTDPNLQAKVVAWMIVSQQHERFAALWLKFYEEILPCLNK